MPSFNIHLAIAIRYCEKNFIENKNEFYAGSVEPDLVQDKRLTHYSKDRDRKFLEEYLNRKVDLKKFLENENTNTDYQKGVFLHLITDYKFFTEFLDKEFIRSTEFPEFIKCLYCSYNESNEYLENKYNISKERLGDELYNKIQVVSEDNKENFKNLIPLEKLEDFIEELSNIDLDLYKKQILNL